MNVRILVVDDAAIFRRAISLALGGIPGVEVVGTSPNGSLALARIAELKPDLVTLDLEMPEMDGIAVLREISTRKLGCAVIILTSVSERARELTVEALEAGAFDFIAKPDCRSPDEGIMALRQRLAPSIALIRRQLDTPTSRRPWQVAAPPSAASLPAASHGREPIVPRRLPVTPRMILIAVSTGGPAALAQIFPELPSDLNVPIFVVQHMPPLFTQSLAKNLASKSTIQVKEAAEGDVAQPGTAYLAPGGKHLKLAAGKRGEIVLRITNDPPENNCRPAADYLFRSSAAAFPGQALAVVLTGMGNDGTHGLRALKKHGCFAIAQDEATSIVFGMPREAIQAGLIDCVLPLDKVAAVITRVVREPA